LNDRGQQPHAKAALYSQSKKYAFVDRSLTIDAPMGEAMLSRDRYSISGGKKSRGGQCIRTASVAAALVFAVVAGIPDLSRADEGGGSFWQPGTYDSPAAVPDQPGWSFSATYNHVSTSAGSSVAAAREISIGRLDPT
jgi:hypothetical protein